MARSGIRFARTVASYLPPVNTAAPVVTGTATSGSTLSCSLGTWTTEGPVTYTYQWLRSGVEVAGATSPTLLLGAAHVGGTMSCRVTATNAMWHAISATSNATAAVV